MCLGASVPAAFSAANSKRGSYRESHYQSERRPSHRSNGKQQQQVVQHTDVDESVLGKTKLCKFYTRGHCSLGRSCNFAHGRKELRAAPNLFRTEMCFEYMSTGWCFHGANCKYAHSEADLRSVAAPPSAEAAEPSSTESDEDMTVATPTPSSKALKTTTGTPTATTPMSISMSTTSTSATPMGKTISGLRFLPAAATKSRGKFMWADVQQYDAEEQWSETSEDKDCSPTASATTAKSMDLTKFSSEASGGSTEVEEDQEVVVTWVVRNSCLDLVPLKGGARNRSLSTPPGSA